MRAFPPFGEPVQARRGMVLLIVITLLTLFAVTGLSFVFYAESEARSAKAFRESADNYRPDIDPETALAFFLGKLIYGEKDDESGAYSALRGHDLARGVYGANYDIVNGTVVLNLQRGPFNGTGRTHYLQTAAASFAGKDDYELVNYQWFSWVTGEPLRDPERYGTRANLAAARGQFTGGFNVPWTYPDLNNFYLGAVRADGTVLTPSFHREYLFGRLDDQTNPNWTNPAGKYLTLRPRPADHLGFPYPEGRFGDVQNLPWGINGPDSIWIDIGAPVITAPDGRKYKMLVAPLIIDLDGRINLNVAGNIKNGGAYTGNQGWGRWEINTNKVLPVAAEAPNLFQGRTNPTIQGRYPQGAAGPGGPALAAFPTPPFYSLFDFDGNGGGLTLPAGTTSVWPTYPATYLSGSAAELANHPARYNPLSPIGGDRLLSVTDIEALLRYGDKGSPALPSESFGLLPQNFNPATNARARGLVTHRSFDLATAGQVPWVLNPATAGYAYNPNTAYPTGPAIPFPTVNPRTAPPAGSDFDANWQAIPAVLSRLDLNRKLTDYPAPDPTTGLIAAANTAAFTQAQTDRQNFARDIYNVLVKATGARDPNTDNTVVDAGATQPAFQAARWLAQLAVNIVDYIDNDDYLTPFNWLTAGNGEWVFGTELPRLVLNEAYAQFDNDGADPGLIVAKGKGKGVNLATHYQLNIWVELHNPFKTVADLSRDNGNATLQSPSQAVYKVVLTKPNTNLRAPANLRGDPDNAANVLNNVGTWGTTAVQKTVLPANGATLDATKTNVGFYVLGPQTTFFDNAVRNPNLPVTLASPNMSTLYPIGAGLPTLAANAPTVLLRRLACPHMPFNATTNPYVTVDYIENVPVHDNREFSPGRATNNQRPTRWTSVGRKQPWAGSITQQTAQTRGPLAQGNQPNNTFYSQNLPAEANYQWLIHLDRQLISPMELLHVSGYRPHELLQQFRTTAIVNQFTHCAPWFQTNTRLHRFFEFAGTHDYFNGTSMATRRPGLVNINTVWDVEILRALIGNNDPWANTIFNQIAARRTPGLTSATGAYIGPTNGHLATAPGGFGLDRPYRSLATGWTTASPAVTPAGGQYPTDTGIDNTILQRLTANTDSQAQTVFSPTGSVTAATRTNPIRITSANHGLVTGQQVTITGVGGNTNANGTFIITRVNANVFSLNGVQSNGTYTGGGAWTLSHPYERHQLLTKVFNSVTTRSNVFAVFVTVGFFEVKDDTTRPVKLGAEVGRADNRHVRHRMFAIVDRSDTRITLMSQLTATPQAVTLRMAQGVTVTPGQTVPITETLPKDYSLTFQTANGAQFSIQPGTTLVYDPDTVNEEIVTVASVNTTANPQSFVVNMRQSHAQGTPIVIRGNPGPWPSYSPRNDRGVVPYFSIID